MQDFFSSLNNFIKDTNLTEVPPAPGTFYLTLPADGRTRADASLPSPLPYLVPYLVPCLLPLRSFSAPRPLHVCLKKPTLSRPTQTGFGDAPAGTPPLPSLRCRHVHRPLRAA